MSVFNAHKIQEQLLAWYRQHKRDLPWRNSQDPYKIWISEIILQQTRVEQGTDYYIRFIKRFPDLPTLASAHPDDVLKLWEGLGYYTRARNLHRAAQIVMKGMNGVLPQNAKGLLGLPGIGIYTASAIASIAFGEPVASVDGNVIRVLSRLAGIKTSPQQASVKRRIQNLATELLDNSNPGDSNQAIMDFGALICIPASPLCTQCPLCTECKAYRLGITEKLPGRPRKVTLRTRYFHYLVLQSGDDFLLHKRTDKDIWHSLYEFPLAETSHMITPGKLAEALPWSNATGNIPLKISQVSGVYHHLLSHQKIVARFYKADMVSDLPSPELPYIKVPRSKLQQYTFPALLLRYLRDENLIPV